MRISGVLPYYFEEEKGPSGMTSMAGLVPYLELMQVIGLPDSVRLHLHMLDGGQGWTPSQLVVAGVLLNLAGGDCIDDLDRLNADAGIAELLRRLECHGMPQWERQEMERRFRKGRERSLPSASAMHRFVEKFHDEEQEELRVPGKAFVPAPTEQLRGIYQTNWDMAAFAQSRHPVREATFDIDAVLTESDKKQALHCYEGYKAYQALNIYWVEHGLIVHSEFRDGNVPAAYQIQRVFDEWLQHLPAGVEEISVRSDTAAYQIDFLHYLDSGAGGRFQENGKPRPIWFAIGVDITREFKEAVDKPSVVWQAETRLNKKGEWEETGKEFAEVGYVSNALAYSKKDPEFRFIAIRELLEQPSLPGMEEQQQLPFATIALGGKRYKLHGIVTNRDWEIGRVVDWYNQRCGKSEEAHAVMKHDLAGGKLPSKRFGANAAWWGMMILSLNLNEIMKRLVLGGEWVRKRLKAIRFAIIHVAGRVIRRARQIYIRLSKGHPALELLARIRQGIAALAAAPG